LTVLDVRKLILLREVAARGSIAAAAQAQHLTRSAVSQQLTALEAEVGRPLLNRTGRRAVLTAEGRLLVRHAERIVGQLEAAEAEPRAEKGMVTGELRLGVPLHEGPALLVPAAIRLRTRHPRLHITLHGVSAAEGREQVRLGELDAALAARYTQVPEPLHESLHEEGLLTDQVRLALVPDHPLATGASARPLTDFAGLPWLLDRASAIGQLALQLCAEAGFVPDVVSDIADMQAVLALVAAGWGVALVPDLTPDRPDHPVVRIALLGREPVRRTTVVVRAGSRYSPAIAAFLPLLREAAADLQATRAQHGDSSPS
jgi:DNA-binding transcriptional LysR family regulator